MPIYVNLVYIIGTATGLLFPGLILSLLLIDPCTPPYISSIFLCSKSGTVEITNPLIIAIAVDSLMWCHIPGPVALYLGNFFYCFTVFINLVLNRCVNSREEKFHSSNKHLKLEFKYAFSSSQKPFMKMYKCMQILTSQLNETFANLLPLVLSTVASILIFTLFICIRLSSDAQGFGFLIFPLTAIDCILIILVEFSSAGFVNSNSIAYIKALRCSTSNYRLATLQPLRVRLGSSTGWVEKVTPLVVLDFCITQTAGLLLVM